MYSLYIQLQFSTQDVRSVKAMKGSSLFSVMQLWSKSNALAHSPTMNNNNNLLLLFPRAIQTFAQKNQFRSNNDLRTDSVVKYCFDLFHNFYNKSFYIVSNLFCINQFFPEKLQTKERPFQQSGTTIHKVHHNPHFRYIQWKIVSFNYLHQVSGVIQGVKFKPPKFKSLQSKNN